MSVNFSGNVLSGSFDDILVHLNTVTNKGLRDASTAKGVLSGREVTHVSSSRTPSYKVSAGEWERRHEEALADLSGLLGDIEESPISDVEESPISDQTIADCLDILAELDDLPFEEEPVPEKAPVPSREETDKRILAELGELFPSSTDTSPAPAKKRESADTAGLLEMIDVLGTNTLVEDSKSTEESADASDEVSDADMEEVPLKDYIDTRKVEDLTKICEGKIKKLKRKTLIAKLVTVAIAVAMVASIAILAVASLVASPLILIVGGTAAIAAGAFAVMGVNYKRGMRECEKDHYKEAKKLVADVKFHEHLEKNRIELNEENLLAHTISYLKLTKEYDKKFPPVTKITPEMRC